MKLINIIKNSQIIRFFLVGGVNTVVGYSIFALLIFIGLHYSLAVIFSTVLGVLFNFYSTGKFVFNNSKGSLIFKFVSVYALTCVINIALLKILLMMKFSAYIGGLILLIPMALINYTLNKKYTFGEKLFWEYD